MLIELRPNLWVRADDVLLVEVRAGQFSPDTSARAAVTLRGHPGPVELPCDSFAAACGLCRALAAAANDAACDVRPGVVVMP